MREPRTRHGQYVWTTSKLHGWPAFDVNDITLIEDEAAALAATPSGRPLDVRLPPGMRFVPGPGGSCAWSSHHWQKMGDRTQCVACNGYMEPIPGPRDEVLREALETIDRLIMGEESVARETGRGIQRASFRIAGMRAARAALARLTEDAG